jgi:transcription initiation factor TFIIF subunit alpha
MAAYEKHRNPVHWLSARGGRKTEDANSPSVKVEENANPHILPTTSLVYEFGQSAGPGGRQLRAVNKGSLFGDDDDDEESKFANRRRERELGGEGDADELDFEEDFADDDDKYPEDNQDEEAKELEVCFLNVAIPRPPTYTNTGADKEGVSQSEGGRDQRIRRRYGRRRRTEALWGW